MARRKLQEVDASSIADIAFILLAFIIIATTLEKESGLPAVLPQKSENNEIKPEVNERNILEILVNKDDQLMIEKQWGKGLDDIGGYVKEFMTNPTNSEFLPRMEEITEALCKTNLGILKVRMKEAKSAYQKSQIAGDQKKWEAKLEATKLIGSFRVVNKAATIAIAEHKGPVYLRFGRPAVPIFTPENQKFEIGKAVKLTEGTDVTIVATGHLVWEALEASKVLFEKGITAEVINIHTIKPLDEQAIIESVSKTGCIVTAEEHNFLGGLGESVARTLALNKPTPQEFVATNDTFGESGTPAQLMEKYGLNSDAIVEKAHTVIGRK